MNVNSRTRCVLVCAAFIGLFTIFSFRLIHLQAVKHDEYAGMAAEKHVHKQIIHAERGSIVDANGDIPDDHVPVQTVVADDSHINNVEALIQLLNGELKIPVAELNETLRGDRKY